MIVASKALRFFPDQRHATRRWISGAEKKICKDSRFRPVLMKAASVGGRARKQANFNGFVLTERSDQRHLWCVFMAVLSMKWLTSSQPDVGSIPFACY